MTRQHWNMTVIAIAAFLAGLFVQNVSGTQAQERSRVFELRTYTTHEGRLPALLERFGGGETELFEKQGMNGVGYWVPSDAPESSNTLVYMLAHESRESAATSWAGFGSDPDWATMRDASRVDGPIVAKVVSVFLNPTDFSPTR